MSKTIHAYTFCIDNQLEREGRRLVTSIDMDSYKDFESFLKALLKNKEISEEEFEKASAVYYANL